MKKLVVGLEKTTDNNEGRRIRAFEKRFVDLVGELGGNKIQAIVQIGTLVHAVAVPLCLSELNI